MKSCFLNVASEALRLTLTTSTPPKVITVTLDPMPDQGNRARASAKFWVTLRLDYAAAPWSSGVLIVDTRGYPVAWKYEAVGKWLVKALSGAPCVVNLVVSNGAQIPARWTVAREAAAAVKVSGLDVQAVTSEAAAKVQSVQAWGPSVRKTAVLDAAGRMVEAAALAVAVKAVQGGAALGAGSLPVDPPPVDPPPVDPPPVDPPPVDPPPVVWTAGLDTGAVCAVGGYIMGAMAAFDQGGAAELWCKVSLLAGVQYRIDMQGKSAGVGTLDDPCIKGVTTAAGEYLGVQSLDDVGSGLDSRIDLSVVSSGDYFVVCHGYDAAGTFKLSLSLV